MLKIYDVSMAIHPGMAVYKNKAEKRPAMEVSRDESKGILETRLYLDAHTGTHVDAPLHVIPGGPGVESLSPAAFFGPCRVLDLTGVPEKIERRDLMPHGLSAGDFILFQTRNSWSTDFDFNFVYISAEAAQYLAEAGVRGVGLDALGVERDQPGYPTHRTLLARNIMVIEGLRLKEVPPGSYFLLAAPLLLPGVEAAPARVLLAGRQDFYSFLSNMNESREMRSE
ncbi:cyclase family protein [Desulfotomaculum copahuensis]|nr:cyclase family protein [Desulfotomaculum copahuensis]